MHTPQIDVERLKTALCTNDVLFLERAFCDGLDVNFQFPDEDNDTLLHYAISDPDSAVLELILAWKPDPFLVNDLGETVLHSAVYSGDAERIRVLISSLQVDVDARQNDGATPLLIAASLHKVECSLMLLELGADPNMGDNGSVSPLHLAAQTSLVLTQELVAKGAVVNAKTLIGNYPMALAVNAEQHEIVVFLFGVLYG